MQAFLVACAIAIIVAVGAVFILDTVQEPSSVAYSSPTSVRI